MRFSLFHIFVVWLPFICHNLNVLYILNPDFPIEKYTNRRLADQQNVAMTSQQENAERGKIKSHKLRGGTIHFFSVI